MNPALKLKFYYDHVLGTVYAEGESPFHLAITQDVVGRFIKPWQLPVTASIIDLGCGVGYFLDCMRELGYTNVKGIGLSNDDLEECRRKGHTVQRGDMNFLDDPDESVDLLFSRHSLEHSPFPYITLLEYNRVLKPGGKLYIEVPQPSCELRHEDNKNHYSILGLDMWASLLKRTGFDVTWHTYEFPVQFDDDRGEKLEKYFIFQCTRRMPVDIK
jgi:SAM-dependent methyltransferase